jgi:DNA-binding NarL/FixJ family response regulator
MNDLKAALDAVTQNKKFLGLSVLDPLIDSVFKVRTPNTVKLTAREQQVMHRIVEGKTSLQIATDLNIAVGTIEAHRRNLMRKLKLHNAVELTHYVLNTH